MIEKFREIGNLAIFKNFNWDVTVREEHGIKKFEKINILYGRNYSGKTTLSRILRAMETNQLPDKYEDPDFQVSFSDDSEINHSNLSAHSETIRVFNEDFVKENLKFILDPDKEIKPFAIVGQDNNKIEKEIRELESELGSDIENERTGLFKELSEADKKLEEISNKYKKQKKELDTQLRAKATGRNTGIKYNSEKFGNQNYDIRNLEDDIGKVLDDEYKPISNEQREENEKLIQEKTLETIPELSEININFEKYSSKTKELIKCDVTKTDKIQELTKDALLNKWVKEGRKLHKNKRSNCAFCGNHIKEDRWEKLENHFDKESEKLEDEISSLVIRIKEEISKVNNSFELERNLFYTAFHIDINNLEKSFKGTSKKYNKSLNSLVEQLKEKRNDIINYNSYEAPEDFSKELLNHWQEYNSIRNQANEFSKNLSDKQKAVKTSLRLREVSDFLETVNYKEQNYKLSKLEQEKNKVQETRDSSNIAIMNKKQLIESKKRELNDEEVGAKKVNKYLKKFFGNDFLYLRSVNKRKTDQKEIFFEVLRDDKIAYNLSEGECNLLAFCYFIAKLEETETADSNPIIWIDDPISSLDSNHIFFVYSLIKSKIVDKGSFKQLFVSTHNLNFLKYLKRLNDGYPRAFFIVDRTGKSSNILPMPKYMKKYQTEFNYLFDQIYKCANIETINDSNHELFYSFGNNARKFLEIFLYYKYPDYSKKDNKLEKFFGDDEIPRILTNRLSNEYSHLSGVFERGATPVEVPEIKFAAQKIIEKLKEDEDQYESLLNSIEVGENKTVL